MVSIKELIKNCGLTKRVLSKKIGVSSTVVYKIFNGEYVGYSAAEAVANYFNYKVEDCKEFNGLKPKSGRRVKKYVSTINNSEKGEPFKCLNENCLFCKRKMCTDEIVYKNIAPCFGKDKVQPPNAEFKGFNKNYDIEAVKCLEEEKKLKRLYKPVY